MRIDFDLVKEILLKIEDETINLYSEENLNNFSYKELSFYSEMEKTRRQIINFHVRYLVDDEGLVKGINFLTADSFAATDPELTSNGVHFLNQIRDNNLFTKAKNNLLKAGIEITKASLVGIISSIVLNLK